MWRSRQCIKKFNDVTFLPCEQLLWKGLCSQVCQQSNLLYLQKRPSLTMAGHIIDQIQWGWTSEPEKITHEFIRQFYQFLSIWLHHLTIQVTSRHHSHSSVFISNLIIPLESLPSNINSSLLKCNRIQSKWLNMYLNFKELKITNNILINGIKLCSQIKIVFIKNNGEM